MKKKLIVGILVIIIAVVAVVYVLNMQNKKLSKDEFINLMKKFDKVENVKIEGVVSIDGKDIQKSILYKKGDYVLSVVDRPDNYKVWGNLKENRRIWLYLDSKEYHIDNDIKVADYTQFDEQEYNFIRI